VPDNATTVLPWRERPPRPARADGDAFLSPVVRHLIAERDLDPATIAGTGEGGRVTRADALEAAKRPTGDETVPFSASRRRTAEHMVRSKATSPHATIVMEVDFEEVARARRGQTGLSYLPFVARAVIDALGAFPNVNASVADDGLSVHRDVHIGIAVDLDFQGLIVPVVRDAADKRLRAIAHEITDLATRARERRLSPDEVVGGTFTITNPGPFGTVLSVPVINQPQVAILATDRVVRRPVVIESERGDSIAVHPIGRLVLSFDHRAFDGAYAAAFLDRVRAILESRSWEAEL
jgi:2-oxoglutarate dehydrogenase E2 component (dihydrolipoamide succinyltransferase)